MSWLCCKTLVRRYCACLCFPGWLASTRVMALASAILVPLTRSWKSLSIWSIRSTSPSNCSTSTTDFWAALYWDLLEVFKLLVSLGITVKNEEGFRICDDLFPPNVTNDWGFNKGYWGETFGINVVCRNFSQWTKVDDALSGLKQWPQKYWNILFFVANTPAIDFDAIFCKMLNSNQELSLGENWWIWSCQ